MYFSWLALHCDQIYELLKAVASKLATPLASEDAGGRLPGVGPSWSPHLPSSSSVFSLERSPWSAGGRRDPTSAQVDVNVQVDHKDEGKDGDDFDDTLKCQHDLTEAKGNMAYQ